MQELYRDKYATIKLNMSEQDVNMPEYVWITIIGRVLNMPGFPICLIQYIAQGQSTSWWVLIESKAYSEPCQRSKIIIAFNYFCKALILNFWEGSEYLLGFKHARALNIPGLSRFQPGFQISRVTQGLPIFVNMTGFWVCDRVQL